jgi:hypothetical protein
MHLSPILKRLIAMGAALGHVQHPAIFHGQFCTEPLAMVWRIGSKIQSHIKHGSSRAPHQFSLDCGLNLEVHAANGAFTHAESHICLDGSEINSMLSKFSETPCTKEASAIIFMEIRVDYPHTRNSCFREPHAAFLPPCVFSTSKFHTLAWHLLTNLKN